MWMTKILEMNQQKKKLSKDSESPLNFRDFFFSLVMMLKQKMIYVRSANAESNLQHLKNKFNSVTRNWDFFLLCRWSCTDDFFI